MLLHRLTSKSQAYIGGAGLGTRDRELRAKLVRGIRYTQSTLSPSLAGKGVSDNYCAGVLAGVRRRLWCQNSCGGIEAGEGCPFHLGRAWFMGGGAEVS